MLEICIQVQTHGDDFSAEWPVVKYWFLARDKGPCAHWSAKGKMANGGFPCRNLRGYRSDSIQNLGKETVISFTADKRGISLLL